MAGEICFIEHPLDEGFPEPLARLVLIRKYHFQSFPFWVRVTSMAALDLDLGLDLWSLFSGGVPVRGL